MTLNDLKKCNSLFLLYVLIGAVSIINTGEWRTELRMTCLFSFAFKKDGKGERHGSAAERLLAAQNPLSTSDRPHT